VGEGMVHVHSIRSEKHDISFPVLVLTVFLKPNSDLNPLVIAN